MISHRSAIRFIVIFFVVYAVLLIPQTGVKGKYTHLLCSQGNELFKDIEKDRVVLLKPQKEDDNIVLTLKFIFRPSGEVRKSQYAIDTGTFGFLPLAFLLSLVAATPLRWKRKIFAFLVGFIMMDIFILLRIRVMILCGLILATGTGINYDEAAKDSIQFWYDYFVVPVALGYYLAIILWIATCLGKKEWQELNGIISVTVNHQKPPAKHLVSGHK